MNDVQHPEGQAPMDSPPPSSRHDDFGVVAARPFQAPPVVVAIVVGCALGLPAGILLAYLAALPVFMGLFFFLLVGLIIGATMYRCARPAIPVPAAACWIMGTSIAVLIWATGIVVEYRWFPNDAAERVARDSLVETPEQDRALREQTRQMAVKKLATEYPPGGPIGYMLWAASDGTMSLPKVPGNSAFTYRLADRPVKWITRVCAAMAFLLFSVLSQVLGLRKQADPEEKAGSDRPGLSESGSA